MTGSWSNPCGYVEAYNGIGGTESLYCANTNVDVIKWGIRYFLIPNHTELYPIKLVYTHRTVPLPQPQENVFLAAPLKYWLYTN